MVRTSPTDARELVNSKRLSRFLYVAGKSPQCDANLDDGTAALSPGGAHEAVETEALSQRPIVRIVRDRLDALLPVPLEAVRVREGKERERLRALLRGQRP